MTHYANDSSCSVHVHARVCMLEMVVLCVGALLAGVRAYFVYNVSESQILSTVLLVDLTL
jgi:hypothetical protein